MRWIGLALLMGALAPLTAPRGVLPTAPPDGIVEKASAV